MAPKGRSDRTEYKGCARRQESSFCAIRVKNGLYQKKFLYSNCTAHVFLWQSFRISDVILMTKACNQRGKLVTRDYLILTSTGMDEDFDGVKLVRVLAGVFNRSMQRAESLILRPYRPAMHCARGRGIYEKLVCHCGTIGCNSNDRSMQYYKSSE